MDEVPFLSSELTSLGQVVAIAARLLPLILKLQSAESSLSLIRSEILDVELTKNSVVALNGILFDPTPSVLDSDVLQEILSPSLTAAQSTDVSSMVCLCLSYRMLSRRQEFWPLEK